MWRGQFLQGGLSCLSWKILGGLQGAWPSLALPSSVEGRREVLVAWPRRLGCIIARWEELEARWEVLEARWEVLIARWEVLEARNSKEGKLAALLATFFFTLTSSTSSTGSLASGLSAMGFRISLGVGRRSLSLLLLGLGVTWAFSCGIWAPCSPSACLAASGGLLENCFLSLATGLRDSFLRLLPSCLRAERWARGGVPGVAQGESLGVKGSGERRSGVGGLGVKRRGLRGWRARRPVGDQTLPRGNL